MVELMRRWNDNDDDDDKDVAYSWYSLLHATPSLLHTPSLAPKAPYVNPKKKLLPCDNSWPVLKAMNQPEYVWVHL